MLFQPSPLIISFLIVWNNAIATAIANEQPKEAQLDQTKNAPSLHRSVNFSFGYLERIFNSNEGLASYPASGIQFYSKVFDSVTEGTWATSSKTGRALVSVGESLVSYWLSVSLLTPFHEFGHGQVVRRFGGDFVFNYGGYGTIIQLNSFWSFAGLKLVTPPDGFPGSGPASMSSTVPPNLDLTPPNLIQHMGGGPGWLVIFSGAGLNNQTLLAKKIADLTYRKNGHINYTLHYLSNKITQFIYPIVMGTSSGSDTSKIVSGYLSKGYSISTWSLQRQSLIGLLSGSTFAFFRGYHDYVQTGSPVVRSVELGGFRVPDINGYITSKGLSYELVTGYRWNDDLRFDFEFESVFEGESIYQFTPRVHYQLASLIPSVKDLVVSADVIISSGIGGSLSGIWTPLPPVSLAFKFIHYNAFTLYGERNIPFINNSATGQDYLGEIHYNF